MLADAFHEPRHPSLISGGLKMNATPPVRLTLDKVVVRVIQAPLRRPIVAKVGEFKNWPFILTDVLTKEGVIGHSYVEPYRATATKSVVALIDDLAEQQRGKPVAPFDRFEEAMRSLHLLGRQGVMLFAIAALDMAMWDALAKALGLPLVAMLGGAVGPVRAYNTNGLWLIPVERLADEASSLVAEGEFSALKIRLGRDNVKDDLKAIADVRRAVGDDIVLMSDFNQGLSFNAALRRLHQLDDQGLEWFEEPIVFDDFSGSARLANELKTPLQIGENIYGPRHFLQAVAAGAADCYMPDLGRIGGVTGWLRAAAIAGAAGLPMSTHLYPEFSAHLMRVTETADWLEWRDWGNPFLAEPFAIRNSAIHVPDRPGAGIAWDEAAVKKFAI
jgi:mandelate racemase